ncbi:MAG TPA: type IV pilin protein [Steroidobacteraceae bacterium]|nr:type IV pilin protein [Steroidobacteraceae bacterium]
MTPEHRISAIGPLRHGRHSGFTLIELMIVLVIAAILIAIAVPMYSNQVRESRRTDARSALLDLAGREERYFATNNIYTNSAANLGYAAFPATVGSGYYQVSAPTVPAGGATYSITATPIGTQAADTACASFTVTSTGQETSTGTGSAATCWGQ